MSVAARRPLYRAPHLRTLARHNRSIADARPFAPGDLVLLRQKLDRSAPPILSPPLKAAARINSHKGVVLHDDIIGKRVRDVIKTTPGRSGKDGTEYRLHEVKLEEYARLSRRLVTPIYPADARLIVELFDLHVQRFDCTVPDAGEPTLEILEAGTGHGALTLYLSRAIHLANPHPPRFSEEDSDVERQNSLAKWKPRRRAILHTIDSSAKFAHHAEKVVRGFRHGLYHPSIDFHVADVGVWTRHALAERGNNAFLSHAFLDLPNADTHLSVVANALRTDGCLVVFNPSVTQILDCVRKIKEEGILLEMENVIELGVNGSSGGREWNVKAVKPKVKTAEALRDLNQEVVEDASRLAMEEDATEEIEEINRESIVPTNHDSSSNERWAMVCRPKVGERIVGGGFLGVWRKQRAMQSIP